jgi:hypothetical protein
MQTFYGIIKTREDAPSKNEYDLDFIGGYSYMRNTNTAFKPSKAKADSTPKQAAASKTIKFQGSSL